MKSNRQFPNHIKWFLLFIVSHWLLMVVVMGKADPIFYPFFSVPLLFPNIKEIWIPHFPGSSAHIMLFANSILGGGFCWYFTYLLSKDTRAAKSRETPAKRWPAILSIIISGLLLLLIDFIASCWVEVPESGAEPYTVIPLGYISGVGVTVLLLGVILAVFIALRKASMKWYRPLLVLAVIVATFVLSCVMFEPKAEQGSGQQSPGSAESKPE